MLVPVTGRVSDHSGVALIGRAARLFFVPTQANTTTGGLRVGTEVQATLNEASGSFYALVDNEAEYIIRMDWLANPDDPQNLARRGEEWPYTLRPDVGGEISDLVDIVVGNDFVWASPTAPDPGIRTGFQLNTVTNDLFQRKVTY